MFHYRQGHKAPTICRLLQEEYLGASRVGIDKFLKKFRETATIARTPGSGRPSKVTEEIKSLVEARCVLMTKRLSCNCIHCFPALATASRFEQSSIVAPHLGGHSEEEHIAS